MDKPPIYRALIVDDEAAVRQLTIRALAIEGFQCQTAADGREAQQLLRDTTYDVIVTDLRMPNLNGHALITELMQSKYRPVIVVLTGVLEPSLVKDLITRGVEQIEFKPIDCTMFGAKVHALVSRYRLHLSAQASPGRDADSGRASLESLRAVGMNVANLMTRDIHTTTPVATMRDVAQKMAVTGVRHLPVVDYKHQPVGMITQRDLFRHMGRKFDDERLELRGQVGEFMSTDLESVSPLTPLVEATEKMLTKKFGCLPVIGDGRRLVGILTRSDLLRYLVTLQRSELAKAQPVSVS